MTIKTGSDVYGPKRRFCVILQRDSAAVSAGKMRPHAEPGAAVWTQTEPPPPAGAGAVSLRGLHSESRAVTEAEMTCQRQRRTYSQAGRGLCEDTRTGCGGAGTTPSRGRCRRSPAWGIYSPSSPLWNILDQREKREMEEVRGQTVTGGPTV